MVEVPAVADTRVVDVTGCGNSFCGGFLATFSRGGSLEDSAVWGSVSASFMAEERGVPKTPLIELKVRSPCPSSCLWLAVSLAIECSDGNPRKFLT